MQLLFILQSQLLYPTELRVHIIYLNLYLNLISYLFLPTIIILQLQQYYTQC